MRRKLRFSQMCLLVFCALCVAGCGERTDEIFVLSREDGSGTRSAFAQLMGIESVDRQGRRIDRMLNTVEITNSTGVMLSGVAENENAIGYVSMGALNGTVKALEIDGAAATAENVRNGTYPVSRTLYIVMPQKRSSAGEDFVAYICSEQGRTVVEAAGYVSCGNGETVPAAAASGQVTVTGSSSVFPVMEKLAEAYMAVRPEVTVVVQISDSTTGIRDAANGLCDLGMTSRPLTEEEAADVQAIPVALDGIAVIVHLENPVNGLKNWQVYNIYTGSVTRWGKLYE